MCWVGLGSWERRERACLRLPFRERDWIRRFLSAVGERWKVTEVGVDAAQMVERWWG